MFNKEITPKNDYKEVFIGDEKMFVNKDKLICHENDELVCINKSNNSDKVLDIYAKLLDLTIHGENVYKELIKLKGYTENLVKFESEFCNKYHISRLTCIRAINELKARGIVISQKLGTITSLTVTDNYNIYTASLYAKSLLIIL